VTLSSTEAEYYALLSVARGAAWMRHFLLEVEYFGTDIESIIVNGDNQGSLALAENPYHYIRQELKACHVTLHYLPTESTSADGLTKPLNKERRTNFLSLLKLSSQLSKKNVYDSE
jgi:hypothetical protein